MPSAMPCIRCKTKLVKTGGVTGMCGQCRIDDPALAAVQRANAAALKQGVREWMDKVSTPVPGRPGVRKIDMNKVFKS
jgi:hypothetical protein